MEKIVDISKTPRLVRGVIDITFISGRENRTFPSLSHPLSPPPLSRYFFLIRRISSPLR